MRVSRYVGGEGSGGLLEAIVKVDVQTVGLKPGTVHRPVDRKQHSIECLDVDDDDDEENNNGGDDDAGSGTYW